MLEVAVIVKPQGIKGEVKAMPLTNVLAVFDKLKIAYIDEKEVKIKHISLRQGFLYILFDGVQTRNEAEALRNKKISLPKEALEKAKGDYEFLLDDLIGMVLYDTDGGLVGQIVDVENYGATDNFVIDCNGRTVQAPFLKDVFLIENDKLVVDKKKFDEVKV